MGSYRGGRVVITVWRGWCQGRSWGGATRSALLSCGVKRGGSGNDNQDNSVSVFVLTSLDVLVGWCAGCVRKPSLTDDVATLSYYTLDGQKLWISNAEHAGVFIVFATVDKVNHVLSNPQPNTTTEICSKGTRRVPPLPRTSKAMCDETSEQYP